MNDKEFEENYYSIEELKTYMNVSVSRKLDFLEEMNQFLDSIKPTRSKQFEEKLRQEGW